MIFYAIGGANYIEEDTKLVDLEILKEVNKEHPRVLYIPLANSDNEKKANIFKKYYESMNAYVDILYILKDNLSRLQIEEAIEKCDIIYLSGGSSKVLYDNGIKVELDKILRKYLDKKIICGVSAGAMIMFEYGYSDLQAYSYHGEVYNCQMVKCFSLIKGAFCPHYDQSGYFDFNDDIKKLDTLGYAVTNGCAIRFTENGLSVFKNKFVNGAYSFKKERDYQVTPLR